VPEPVVREMPQSLLEDPGCGSRVAPGQRQGGGRQGGFGGDHDTIVPPGSAAHPR